MSPKTVFQIKKMSGWDTTEVKDIQRGESFRILVDGVPLVQESGSTEFTAAFDAFLDDGEWRVSIV